jgi:hypothetical protein
MYNILHACDTYQNIPLGTLNVIIAIAFKIDWKHSYTRRVGRILAAEIWISMFTFLKL